MELAENIITDPQVVAKHHETVIGDPKVIRGAAAKGVVSVNQQVLDIVTEPTEPYPKQKDVTTVTMYCAFSSKHHWEAKSEDRESIRSRSTCGMTLVKYQRSTRVKDTKD